MIGILEHIQDRPVKIIYPQILLDIQQEAGHLLPFTHQPYIGLAPGAGRRHKCWSFENYINLVNDLYKKSFIPVILLGHQNKNGRTSFNRL